ncbi:MAG: metalloendopeptidase, partial [Pseudanabaena sp.]
MKPYWKISLRSSLLLAVAIASCFPLATFAISSKPTTPTDESNAKEAEELCGKPTLDDLIQHKVKQG